MATFLPSILYVARFVPAVLCPLSSSLQFICHSIRFLPLSPVPCGRVRAFAGWPGTWALFSWGKGEQRKIKLITTSVGHSPAAADGDKAEVFSERGRRVVLRGDALELTCADGSILRVLELQPLNKNVMGAKAFANGLRGEEIRWVEHEVTEAVAAGG